MTRQQLPKRRSVPHERRAFVLRHLARPPHSDAAHGDGAADRRRARRPGRGDRKSTRLNSSHQIISYAVFCLKKKKTTPIRKTHTNPTSRRAAHLTTRA